MHYNIYVNIYTTLLSPNDYNDPAKTRMWPINLVVMDLWYRWYVT